MMDRLAGSYAEARSRFLAAAKGAGAQIATEPHPLVGLQGEDLGIDVATIGSADAESAVIVVSGTHGVEGYLGSAIQTGHLESLETAGGEATAPGARARANAPRLVFIHALNPYGFSWVRRVNEDNVDLNRNFIDWSGTVAANEQYSEIAELLVPGDWSEQTQERTLQQLMALLDEFGLEHMQSVVSSGQWHHPEGIFYGGRAPTWSNEALLRIIPRAVGNSGQIAVIDLHTGLGEWGHGELISSQPPTTERFARQRRWWPDVVSLLDGSSVSAAVQGEWTARLPDMVPGVEDTSITIEYGTVDIISVVQALRADAALHAHGDPRSAEGDAIRSQVRSAFLDDDPGWLHRCRTRYDEVFAAAVQHL
ncbi:MAG: M14 family metallopeptidase [Microthrixaceae bacterium]